MSLRPCVRDGRQRPVHVTCCEHCELFPRCLPPESSQLRASIGDTFQAGALERETIAELLATLEATLQGESDAG
jgi:hypothetical protein